MSIARQIGMVAVLVAAAAAAAYAGHAAYTGRMAQPGGAASGEGRGGGDRAAASVILATAELAEVESRLEAVGTSRALRAVEIVPLTSGRVVRIAFRPGQKVLAGDTLAELDDEIERADLTEAEARLDEAELALARAMTLSESNTISQASVEQLRAARVAARAQVDRALRRFADRTVIAPFDGIVGLGQVEVGARVDDDTVITTLDDLSRIEIEFQLPETVFGQVQPGDPVAATSAAYPGRTFAGEVASIDSRIDRASRAFKVRAVVPNEDLALAAGMFMHLSVVLDSHEGLMVPEEAVVVEGGRMHIFVVEDGKASRRIVSLGKRELGRVEITDGLAEGEKVVARGVQSLRDGAPVKAIGDGAGAGEAAPEAGAERQVRG